MYRPALILLAVFWGANIAVVQTSAQAKSRLEVARIAKNITLYIETAGVNKPGSGVLLQKQEDVYSVLTAAHVVAGGSSFQITTPDGQVHQSISVNRASGGLDLAIVKFRSDQDYQLAKMGTSNSLEIGAEIYIAGFPEGNDTVGNGVFVFTAGSVTAITTKPNNSGYSLIYDSITKRGMSGGAVLNKEGELVAIHGQGDRDANKQKTGLNLGITIERIGSLASSLEMKTDMAIDAAPLATVPKADSFFFTGYEKNKKGDYQGALADYDKAIELNPQYALVYNKRGILKDEQLNDLPGALADYNKAIEINPQYALAHSNRGALFEKLNDISRALTDYNKAIELDPQLALAYNNRGGLRDEKFNEVSGALMDYNKAIELDPQLALAYGNRANLRRNRLNEVSGALMDYNRAIELDPQFAYAYYHRGLLKKDKLKDRTGAAQDFREAAYLYRQQGQTKELQKAIEQLKKLGVTEEKLSKR